MTSRQRLPSRPLLQRQLEQFTIRAVEIFGAVVEGRTNLFDGVDLLHNAAVASGLADAIGEDSLQRLLVAAFATAAAETER